MTHLKHVDREDFLEVKSKEELLNALRNGTLISEDFKKEFVEKTNLPLSETEQLGFNLGFRGTVDLISEVF